MTANTSCQEIRKAKRITLQVSANICFVWIIVPAGIVSESSMTLNVARPTAIIKNIMLNIM